MPRSDFMTLSLTVRDVWHLRLLMSEREWFVVVC
jgi:hypothetical protein